MKALICDLCNGPLTIEAGGEFAVCEYCGVKYSMERLREKVQAVTGTVEVVTGSAELERLCENAETLLRLGEYKRASDAYADLTKQFPGDWRGWWGIVRLTFAQQSTTLICDVQNDIDYPAAWRNACSLCPDQTIIRQFFADFARDYGTAIHTLSWSTLPEHEIYHAQGMHYAAHLTPDGSEITAVTVPDPFSVWLWQTAPVIFGEFFPTDFAEALRRDSIAAFTEGRVEPVCTPDISEVKSPSFSAYTEEAHAMSAHYCTLLEDKPILAALLANAGYTVTDPLGPKTRIGSLALPDRIDFALGKTIFCTYLGGYSANTYFAFTLPEPLSDAVIARAKASAAALRQSKGICRHCGGEFRGLFRQKCEKCGKPKDY